MVREARQVKFSYCMGVLSATVSLPASLLLVVLILDHSDECGSNEPTGYWNGTVPAEAVPVSCVQVLAIADFSRQRKQSHDELMLGSWSATTYSIWMHKSISEAI